MDSGELYDDAYWEDMNSKIHTFAGEYAQWKDKNDNNNKEVVEDEVNHPSRYFHNGIETIDVIEAWTSELTGVEAFCIGNAIKYLSRWKDKGGKEDLRKAVWYIQRVIDGGG